MASCATQLMHSSDANTNADVRRLTHILAGAYGNAIRHNQPTADLESEDLILENASIRFSSLIAREIASTCGDTIQRAGSFGRNCVLDEQAADLRNLSDMLSYAASRLENQSRIADHTTTANALHQVRIGSLEHLYRMVFALAKVYFDRPQSEAYLKAAHEQINLARTSIEKEQQLCSGDAQTYTTELEALARLDDAILNIQAQP